MRILSLFDGMACGYLAMQRAGVDVEAYHAYEIDKYAIKTAQHNFPDILEHGDVFTADFTVYRGLVDFLVGGSPCTYWSIAQKNNRETEASGLGWELFSQYVRALHEAKPRYFIYENNKSMAKAIRDQIREAFGFEEICINSALVSAQNRQRLYWVGKRNENGTYSKVDVKQPEDLKIFMDEIFNQGDFAPYNGGSMTRIKDDLTNHYPKSWQIGQTGKSGGQAVRVYDLKGKSVTLKSQAGGGGAKTGLYLHEGMVKSLSKSGCMKLQTVPDWYQFPVNDGDAISLLGNGWTVDVIAHLIKACLEDTHE